MANMTNNTNIYNNKTYYDLDWGLRLLESTENDESLGECCIFLPLMMATAIGMPWANIAARATMRTQ